MKVEEDQKCFVCGPENRLGLNVTFYIDSRHHKSEANVIIADDYQGWQGVVHGGIIAALLDEAAIYACRPVAMQSVTAGLDIRYFKPVPVHSELRVQAEVLSVKRKIANVKSTIWLDHVLMAEARVKVMFINKKEGS